MGYSRSGLKGLFLVGRLGFDFLMMCFMDFWERTPDGDLFIGSLSFLYDVMNL